MAAVQQNAWALDFASSELKSDREIVWAAIQQNGRVLACASDDLKNDLGIVLAAVQQNGRALQYASMKSVNSTNSCTQKHARAMARKDIRNLHLVNEKHRGDMAWLFAKN